MLRARGLEVQIVEAIASTPALAALVDELFFEYHFNTCRAPPCAVSDSEFKHLPSWAADLRAKNRTDTVDDALQLMHRLRVAGVRSHFWI